MVFVLRTKNPGFESGNFPPWLPTGNVVVEGDVTCSGNFTALFDGAGTGVISQTNIAYPNRQYRLLFAAGASGGAALSPLLVTVDFLGGNEPFLQLKKRVQFQIPPGSLPDVTGATPVDCADFDLNVGISPNGTQRVRLTFTKPQPGGADILVDSVFLIEQAG
jgi:hypothetical protein